MPTYLRVLSKLTYAGIFWFVIISVPFGIIYCVEWLLSLWNISTLPDFIVMPVFFVGVLTSLAAVSAFFWSPGLFILSVVSFIVERRYRRKNNVQYKKFYQYPSFWLGVLSAATFIFSVWAISSGAILFFTPN